MANETLVKVKDLESTIDELDMLVTKLSMIVENKDLMNFLNNYNSLKNDIDRLEEIFEDVKKFGDEFVFNVAAINKIIDKAEKTVKEFEKFHVTIADILQTQTSNITTYITDNYDKMFKVIKNDLLSDLREFKSEIKIIKEELKNVYEQDYFKDIRAVKAQLKLLIFMFIAVIIGGGFLFYKLNKKVDAINVTTYYNYKALYNQ